MGNRWRKGRRHAGRRNRGLVVSLGQEGQLIGMVRPGVLKVLVGTSLLDVPEADFRLHQDQEERPEPHRTGKGARLGKFRSGPMFSTTLDLHGLNVADAIEMVSRKLNRALLADVDSIRLIQPKDVRRLERALLEYLGSLKFVDRVEPDEDNPAVTWVHLRPSAPTAP